MESIVDIIKMRVSVRTYEDIPVEEEKVQKLTGFFDSNTEGPFGNRVKFQIIDLTDMDIEEIKTFGTYGVIKNARIFMVGVVKRAEKAMEDFGYCMERNLLKATELGLGTCWLGGTFNRSSFAQKIGTSESELLPAISPVGYAGDRKSITEKTLRFLVKSRHRKPWKEIFFNGDIDSILSEDDAGQYRVPLECVRIAPSASNQQPWRIIRDESGRSFHLYLKRTKGYDRLFGEISLQNIDMGIAMCHFELSAKEVGIKGSWDNGSMHPDIQGLEYVVSWVE